MKMFGVLVVSFVISAAAPGAARSSRSHGYQRLPPVADRTIIGQWSFPYFCTGAIIAGNHKTYWANDCLVNTGCCNGDFGYVLQHPRKNVFVIPEFNVTLTIQTDGTLREERPGDTPSVYEPWSSHSDGPSWTQLEN